MFGINRELENFSDIKGYTLLDIGAAEGIISLEAIDYVEKAYLFECDEKRINALSATFADYTNKVSIVKKYVGEIDNEDNITLDTFLKENEIGKIFIKMDIEGSEIAALRGANSIFKNPDLLINFAICTYHTPTDADRIKSHLDKFNFHSHFSEGYLLCSGDLRRGVIRGNN